MDAPLQKRFPGGWRTEGHESFRRSPISSLSRRSREGSRGKPLLLLLLLAEWPGGLSRDPRFSHGPGGQPGAGDGCQLHLVVRVPWKVPDTLRSPQERWGWGGGSDWKPALGVGREGSTRHDRPLSLRCLARRCNRSVLSAEDTPCKCHGSR